MRRSRLRLAPHTGQGLYARIYVYILLSMAMSPDNFASRIPCALFNLKKTTRAVNQLYDEILKPSGLRGNQYTLFKLLTRQGPLSIGDIGQALVMDRTTVTRNLRVLSRDGLIEMCPGEDRRIRLARITSRGRTVAKEAEPLWQEAQETVVRHLGAEEFRHLRAELARLVTISLEELKARDGG